MTPVRVGLCFDHHLLCAPHLTKALTTLDILLFPELLDGGYAALRRGARPHHSGDTLLTDVVTTSMTTGACIVAGSMLFEDRRGRTNTTFVYQGGRLIHRYDKVHLFKPAGDPEYFIPGSTITPFIFDAGEHRLRAGVVICYDLRFPELTRSLAQQGIRILFVPARWPLKRDDAWRTLLKARAIENQVFVIGCNAPGGEGGHSYAYDPLGRLIGTTRGRGRSSFVTFTMDLEAIAEAHAMHTNIADALLLTERPPLRKLRGNRARRARTSLRKSGGG